MPAKELPAVRHHNSGDSPSSLLPSLLIGVVSFTLHGLIFPCPSDKATGSKVHSTINYHNLTQTTPAISLLYKFVQILLSCRIAP